jgi:hypothetical protein
MANFKINKSKDFTVMSNYHLRDKKLSLKAKGLLSYMFSLPQDWDYSTNGLVAICKESRDAIKTTLDELKRTGYLEIEKVRGEKGTYEYNYIIRETPKGLINKDIHPDTENPPLDNPPLDNPTLGEPDMDNPIQINTNKQNIKNKIEKIDTIDKTNSSSEALKNPFIIDLIKSGYIQKDEYNLPFYESLFDDYEDRGYSKVDIYTVIHYIVPRVIKNDFKDENGEKITNKFGYLKSSMSSNFRKLNNMNTPLYPEDDELEL